jgi:hypothetical protein
MDLAWDVNAWTPEKAHQYAEHWASETFGSESGSTIADIKKEYYRLAASGKPEHLVSINYSDTEILERLADYDSLVGACEKVKAQIPARLKDAFYQLIEYPVKGAANMNAKILAARLSHSFAGQGKEEALDYAKQAIAAYGRIIDLTNKYNTGISDGKWNGIMDYAPRGLSRFYDPDVATAVSSTDIPPAAEDIVQVIPAADYSAVSGPDIKTIIGIGGQGSALTVWPLNMTTYTSDNITSAPYAEYDVPAKKGANRISIRCLPTFPLYTSLQLRYAVSIGGGIPEFHNIETSAGTSAWSRNVLQGYASGESSYTSPEDEKVKVRVYFTDPGLVVNAVTSTGVFE